MDRADSLGEHADGGLDSPTPVWAVFGDLMAGLLMQCQAAPQALASSRTRRI